MTILFWLAAYVLGGMMTCMVTPLVVKRFWHDEFDEDGPDDFVATIVFFLWPIAFVVLVFALAGRAWNFVHDHHSDQLKRVAVLAATFVARPIGALSRLAYPSKKLEVKPEAVKAEEKERGYRENSWTCPYGCGTRNVPLERVHE